MRDETAQQLKNLIAELRITRGQPLGGAVLFIGGAASSIHGRPAIDELHRQVLLGESGPDITEEKLNSMSADEQTLSFDRSWSDAGNALKTVQWRSLHEQLRPTKGHTVLALLLKENYFPLVLTSTIDLLMESVFIRSTVSEGQPLRPWSVLVNGRDKPEDIQDAIQSISLDTATTIFLKLCGDIQSGTFAVTREEVKARVQDVEKVLETVLRRRNLIMVGFTPLDDVLIPSFPSVVGGKVIFIGTERPSQFSHFESHRWSQRPTYILDSELDFDVVFQLIAERLNLIQEFEQVTGKTLKNKEELDRFDQATQGSQTAKEDLVQIIKTEQRQESVNKQSPFVTLIETTIFTVKVDTNHQVSFEVVGGGLNYTGERSKEWLMDVASLNQEMQDLGYDIATYHRLQDQRGRDKWRRQAKREGQRLYAQLIEADPDLHSKLELARQTTVDDDPANLTLVFTGPRDYLGLPYELLHDEKIPLVVSHPLCRRVSGVTVHHSESFETFIRTLRQKKQRLRVLLLASDSGTLSVNQEITDLQQLLSTKAQQLGLQVEFEVLSSEKASLQEVRKRLSKCSYHLVHYAGHGSFDEATGENSGLRFWQQGKLGKEPAILTAREVATLLAGSETRLFYLSACVGAWTGNEQLLRDNDYLGVMDAVVQAGVPYVLGFRWYIPDSASRGFAQLFYDRLFARRPVVPERAAWFARREVYNNKGTDETWTSPILVAQNPYRS